MNSYSDCVKTWLEKYWMAACVRVSFFYIRKSNPSSFLFFFPKGIQPKDMDLLVSQRKQINMQFPQYPHVCQNKKQSFFLLCVYAKLCLCYYYICCCENVTMWLREIRSFFCIIAMASHAFTISWMYIKTKICRETIWLDCQLVF